MLLVCPQCRCFFRDEGAQICVCSRELLRIAEGRLTALMKAGYRPWVRGLLGQEILQQGLQEVRGLHLVWEEDRPTLSFIEFVDGTRWWMSSGTGRATVYARTELGAP